MQKTRKPKRIISFLLVMVMVLTLLPMTAIGVEAEETVTDEITFAAEFAKLSSGDVTITLGNDITLAGNYRINEVDKTLTINGGYKITCTNTSNPFTVEKGTLVLENITIDGDCGEGGSLSDTGRMGSLIYVVGGDLIMNDGTTITNNKNSEGSGGGVRVTSGAFTMNGGEISNNISITGQGGEGGGVHVGLATFTMTNGKISGNSSLGTTPEYASLYGGGVHNNRGTLNITGGEISGNTANYGGGVYNNGAFTLGGTTVIAGNTKVDKSLNNVYLSTNKVITLSTDTAPAPGMNVGVSLYVKAAMPYSFVTSDGNDTNVEYFHSDVFARKVVHSTGELQVVNAPVSTEEFEFEVTVADNGSFAIPVSGQLGDKDNTYNWNINWGDGATETKTGTGSLDNEGISHTYTTAGTYTITITPAGSTDAWLGAFGFSKNLSGASSADNKNLLTKVSSQLTPLMTRTQAQLNSATAPVFEWAYTFNNCQNITMGDNFNFSDRWNDITTVGNAFANEMFNGCSGTEFNMNNVFNLPQNITTVGNNFANGMFCKCSGATFNMNTVFNLPQNITTVEEKFAYSMFDGCSGAAFTMNDSFNLPTNISIVANHFASKIFSDCTGDMFTMNTVFNLPTGITTVGTYFAWGMFYKCSGSAFKVNDVFVFPVLDNDQLNKFRVFFQTFCYLGGDYPQTRTATSIINGNNIPTAAVETFKNSSCFSDLADISTKWGDIGVQTVTLTTDSGAGGSISPSGVVTVNKGTNQTFTITANSNYSISDVKVDDVSVGRLSTYTFNNVTENHTISATFSYNGVSGGGSVNYTTDAQAPTINTQPTEIFALTGETKTIKVEATVSDGGTLSYQWYVNTSPKSIGGTAISGATSAVYTVPTKEAKTNYYYVVITNTNNNVNGSKTADVTSNAVTITVTERIEPKQFTVTYKVNGGKTVSDMPSDTTKYTSGKTVTVKGMPVSTSQFFAGWNTKADGTGKSYTATKTFKITENITLYAQWKDTYIDSSGFKYRVTGKNKVACIGTTNGTATTITISNSFAYKEITYKVTSIAKNAFRGNKKITTVNIGNNIKTIGNTAFYKCENLAKVTIGTGLTTLGNDVFCHAKDGCVITINSTNLKTVKTAINHGTKNMVIKVPKSKLTAYEKLFAETKKTVTVKAK